jgi:hypothetical protein
MDKKFRKFKVAFCLNIILIVLGIIGAVFSFKENQFVMFKYYTQDSNFLGLLSSILFVITGISSLKAGKLKTVEFVSKLRFMAVCCMCLTFLVVIFVLIPIAGFDWTCWYLFSGSSLFYHTLCPIIGFVSFAAFEDVVNLRFANACFNAIPTVIYAIITITLNALYIIDGPYAFLKVHEQSILMSVIWFILIVGGSWLIAILIYLLKKKNLKVN